MKILFAGEGGQGVQVIAEILARAAFEEGKNSTHIPNFGVEQRGGVSLAFVVIGNQPVVYPKFEKANLVAILSDRSIERVKPYLGPQTKVVLGPAVTEQKMAKIPKVQEVSHLRGVKTKVWNIMVLGKVNRVGKIVSLAALKRVMNKRFKQQFKKKPELKKLDEEALVAEI